MTDEIKIADRLIGRDHSPFVIAEMSGNHNQSLERALEIVEVAARTGAHALKMQTYTPDTMTLDLDEREFHISEAESLWAGTSLYKLYAEAHTPWEWHEPIFKRARELGIIAFSTPFDDKAVDFLESLDVPCYKIASFENTDLPLIRRVAATGKPLIISTGMANLAELDETVRAAREAGCKDLVLLKCTSTYPATPKNSNIITIPHLRELFECEVGLSDHTMGVGVSVASVALGATVIEKHFTLDRCMDGPDHAASLEPDELKQMVKSIRNIEKAKGHEVKKPSNSEEKNISIVRKSIVATKEIKVGDEFTSDNLGVKRPGTGISPMQWDEVVGKVASKNFKPDELITI